MEKNTSPLFAPTAPSTPRHPGEVLVWLTSCGLSIGLLMVLGLLGVVFFNGVHAFWPKPIARVELVSGSTRTLQESGILAGEIVTRRAKVTPGKGVQPEELQLYVANKDAYGISFHYLDVSEVAQIAYPPGICRIERMEYGPALGTPAAIVHRDGQRIEAQDSAFARKLTTLIRETAERRSKIRAIEKTRIGAINRSIESLENKQRILKQRVGGEKAAAEIASLEQRKTPLLTKYETLDAERRALRESQSDYSLVYQLPSGIERQIALGEVVEITFPNQMGLLEKTVALLHNVWEFLRQEPREANTEGGIFPALFGTFAMTLLMSMAVMPFGVVAAIYLREYALQGAGVRAVRIAVNNLAGVPSIVFGVFGLGFFVYFVGGGIDSLLFADRLPTPTMGTGGILWAALTLSLMTVPVVVVATEEALAAVPRSVREGSLACGASKWQTIQRVVLPASAPGILTGLILAMARGAGEVAPLMLVGVVKLAPELPLDLHFPFVHLDQKFMHLGFHIYDLGFQSPDSEAAKPMVFATTLILIGLILALNLTAIVVRERLRRRYSPGAF
jgi:phosphate transport system permease protein